MLNQSANGKKLRKKNPLSHTACRSTLTHESLCLIPTYGYSTTKKDFTFFTFRPSNFQYSWVVFQFRGLKHIWINRTAKLQSHPYASMVVHAQSGTVRKHTVVCVGPMQGERVQTFVCVSFTDKYYGHGCRAGKFQRCSSRLLCTGYLIIFKAE